MIAYGACSLCLEFNVMLHGEEPVCKFRNLMTLSHQFPDHVRESSLHSQEWLITLESTVECTSRGKETIKEELLLLPKQLVTATGEAQCSAQVSDQQENS